LGKLAVVLGILAFVVFGVLPIAVNMITGEYPLSTAIAMNAVGLITIVIPVFLVLGAIPVTTAMVAKSKRDRRLEEQENEREKE